jgi:pimeloyl-ACP methyl ester carboxylesterase
VWRLWIVRFALASVASLGALAALAIYAPLRAIPIDSVRKRVEIAALNTFLVDWLGDLPVILDDPAQSAAIRTRLLDRVAWLRARGCSEIVIVAHSGGTIVSYQTLLRYPQAELPVTKLVTLGEAIRLAWRLEAEAGDWVAGNPLRGDLRVNRPDLRWVDVWASYDPAPSGELVEVTGSPLVAVESLRDLPDDARIHVESRPVTNFMHLAKDHGGYWDNDEGFLIPLIRHLDDPSGDGSESRFFTNGLDRTIRTERRRRRVSLLLAWRWAAFVAAVVALLVAVVRGVDLAAAGDALAGVWALLPGHQLLSGPIDGVGRAVAVVLGAVGWTGLADALGAIGPTLLGAAVPVIAIAGIYLRGRGSWTTHDAIERAAIRGERFGPPGRRSARSEGILLAGGLVAVVLAAAVVPLAAVAAWIVAVAVLAGVARVS